MRKYRIDTSILSSNEEVVDECINTIETSYNNLVSYISTIKSVWKGDAKDTAVIELKNDLLKLGAMLDNIKTLRGKMEYAKKMYESSEQSVAQAMGDL